MSHPINEPGDAVPEAAEPGVPGPGGSEEERLRGELGARPLSEVGVLPLGGEIDPINAADQSVGEVGQLPGVPIDE